MIFFTFIFEHEYLNNYFSYAPDIFCVCSVLLDGSVSQNFDLGLCCVDSIRKSMITLLDHFLLGLLIIGRSKGARCTATPGTVTINDQKFTEANLEDLPSEFAVEKIKMKKIGETIAYSSEHAPFSNLYPAAVPIGKHVSTSSEQGLRHIRAKENKQHNIAARILWSRDTYDMMELDRDMPVSKEWKEKEDFILFKCMFRKFEANEDLRDTLLSTGELELAEATRSSKWATGATMNSTAMKTHTWTGENRQGKHSMKIRDYFKLNQDEFAD